MFPHWEQLKGFSEEWVTKWSLSCLFKNSFHTESRKKALFQHELTCASQGLLYKDFPHWEQLKGFSEEWVTKWSLSWLFLVKLFPHWEQEKGFIPAWINMWSSRLSLRESVSTLRAAERLFWRVSYQMILKLPFPGKTLSTLRAGKRLYPSMK